MSARESRYEDVRIGEELPGAYLVELRLRWAPGHRGAALRGLAGVIVEAVMASRRGPE